MITDTQQTFTCARACSKYFIHFNPRNPHNPRDGWYYCPILQARKLSTERWLSKLPTVTLNSWARIGMLPLKYYMRSRHSINICRMNWWTGICKVLGKVQPQCWHSKNTSWLSFYLCLHVWKNRRHIIVCDFCLRDLPSCWWNMNKKDN